MRYGLDRRMMMLSLAGAALFAGCSGNAPHDGFPLLVDRDRLPDEVWPLWPVGTPGLHAVSFREEVLERDNPLGLPDRATINVTTPSISLFRAKRPDGRRLLLIPGGGYARVVIDKEGYEGARYFSRQGIDCYVLKYRLPHPDWPAPDGIPAPLADALRAMALIRSTGPTGGPVSVMGFSAGGHLAGLLCERYDGAVSRPDSGVLVYPVALMSGPYAHAGSRANLLGNAPTPASAAAFDLTTAPRADGPGLTLVHAKDDVSVPVENTMSLAEALKPVGRLDGLRLYQAGGHGFGFRLHRGQAAVDWPVDLIPRAG